MIFSCASNPRILLSTLLLCAAVLAQTPPNYSPDFSPGPLKKIEALNSAQQQAVEDYVRQGERRTGELKVLVDRNGILLRSSEALRTLFPNDRFVAVTWIYEADPRTVKKYSIPGPTVHTLVLDEEGKDCMAHHTGYLEEYGDLLRAHRIKVTDEPSATMVRAAFTDIYGIGMGSKNLKHGDSEWFLGYREYPFRAISSYEEVREASYYRLTTDSDGVVTSGRLVNEVLERRGIK
jgi:hypothetical protein